MGELFESSITTLHDHHRHRRAGWLDVSSPSHHLCPLVAPLVARRQHGGDVLWCSGREAGRVDSREREGGWIVERGK